MALQVYHEGEIDNLVFSQFEKTSKAVMCHGMRNSNVEIEIAYPLDAQDLYSPNKFTVELLSKYELREQDIFEVYDKAINDRIGWIIPVAALDSTEHSYVQNIHFLQYAAVGLRILLHSETNYVASSPDISTLNYLRLSDFFAEQTALLILNRDKLSEEANKLECLIPGLATYGFANANTSKADLALELPSKESSGRANIRLLPTNTPNLSFISRAFGYLVPYEPARLLRFFYLYQVVELMMEVVYVDQLQKLKSRLVTEDLDPIQLQEALDQFFQLSKEKNRLKTLYKNYIDGRVSADTTPARNACNAFLSEYGHKEFTDFFDALYRTRNVLFHQYYRVSETGALDALVDQLILILPEVVYGLANEASGT